MKCNSWAELFAAPLLPGETQEIIQLNDSSGQLGSLIKRLLLQLYSKKQGMQTISTALQAYVGTKRFSQHLCSCSHAAEQLCFYENYGGINAERLCTTLGSPQETEKFKSMKKTATKNAGEEELLSVRNWTGRICLIKEKTKGDLITGY